MIPGIQSVWLLRFIIFMGWRSFSRLFLWMRDQSQMDLTTFLWEGPPNSLILLVLFFFFFNHSGINVPMIHCHFIWSESIWRSPCFCSWFLPGNYWVILLLLLLFHSNSLKISHVLFPPTTPQLLFSYCLFFLHLKWSSVKPIWLPVSVGKQQTFLDWVLASTQRPASPSLEVKLVS